VSSRCGAVIETLHHTRLRWLWVRALARTTAEDHLPARRPAPRLIRAAIVWKRLTIPRIDRNRDAAAGVDATLVSLLQQAVALNDVRFGAHDGLKSGIAPSPKAPRTGSPPWCHRLLMPVRRRAVFSSCFSCRYRPWLGGLSVAALRGCVTSWRHLLLWVSSTAWAVPRHPSHHLIRVD
jgi:hypothetical protein